MRVADSVRAMIDTVRFVDGSFSEVQASEVLPRTGSIPFNDAIIEPAQWVRRLNIHCSQ
jgi:hypothetical protein